MAVFYETANTKPLGASTRYVRDGDSGEKVTFHFCPICGSTAFWYPDFRPNWVGIAIGCFDDKTLRPTQTVYDSDRRPWVAISTGDE